MLPATISVPLKSFDQANVIRVYRLNRLMSLCQQEEPIPFVFRAFVREKTDFQNLKEWQITEFKPGQFLRLQREEEERFIYHTFLYKCQLTYRSEKAYCGGHLWKHHSPDSCSVDSYVWGVELIHAIRTFSLTSLILEEEIQYYQSKVFKRIVEDLAQKIRFLQQQKTPDNCQIMLLEMILDNFTQKLG